MCEEMDPSYQEYLEKLSNDYPKNSTGRYKICDLMKTDGFKYMMPRSMWSVLVDSNFFYVDDDKHGYDREDQLKRDISYIAYYQFCLNEIILSHIRCDIPYKLLQGRMGAGKKGADDFLGDRNLQLPHADLDYVLHKIEKYSYSPPSKAFYYQYKKSKSLYIKTLSVENDEKEWIKALKEAGDDLFVQQNVEYRLGKDLKNKKLWKLYISYLKDHNITIMLHTYSKYCRFWLDDTEMKREYEAQVKLHGPVSVPWTNLLCSQEEPSFLRGLMNKWVYGSSQQQQPFEGHANLSEFIQTLRSKQYPSVFQKSEDPIFSDIRKQSNIKFRKKCNVFYSKNGTKFQQFPFCSTIMKYLLKNATANVLRKLFMSCKEFFAKQPTPICYKLTLDPDPESSYAPYKFVQESLLICHDNPVVASPVQKMIVQKRLWVFSKTNDLLLSSFFPKIYRCEAKFIEICHQKLSAKEYEFLTIHGFVEELNLFHNEIWDDDGKEFPFEDMMKTVLKIRVLEVAGAFYTTETAQIISELPFKNKIHRFILWNVYVPLDSHSFAKFVEKNAAPNSKIKIVGNFRFSNIVAVTIAKKWKDPHRPKLLYDEDFGFDFPDYKTHDYLWPPNL